MINSPRKKLFIIIGTFIGFVIIISILFIIFNHQTNQKQPIINQDIGAYVDPGTGQTVYYPPQTPENYNNNDTITFLGFSNLLDIGISSNQLNKLKTDFQIYSSTQKIPIKEISITLTTLKQTINQDTDEATVSFLITIDRISNLNTQIKYITINDMFLTLLNPVDNTVVYTSTN